MSGVDRAVRLLGGSMGECNGPYRVVEDQVWKVLGLVPTRSDPR